MKRCMTCKYWHPISECSGKCMRFKNPVLKVPNYVCKEWKFWKE